MTQGTSPIALVNRGLRRRVHSTTGGRCYYCGLPLQLDSEPLARDWILPSDRIRMVIDHKRPIGRGGTEAESNYAPACFRCNSSKASMTPDEFRLVAGLRAGNLSFCFYGDSPRIQRDWLCVHSRKFEGSLIVQSIPGAAKAYGRGKIARR